MESKKKILILCTGNSCRSQMAEGFARQAGWQACSAGTKPEIEVNPVAVKVMTEIGIDISQHTPESINKYLNVDFDIVATVCNNARETCPVMTGSYLHQIHHGFDDPFETKGNNSDITIVYRRIRDEIQVWVDTISEDYLKK